LDVIDNSTNEGGNNFWKNLLRSVLGITISIFLTFGSNALIQWHRKAKDRKMTALMVIGNIEKSIITIWRHISVGRMSKTWR
jgi:hypothetical protein